MASVDRILWKGGEGEIVEKKSRFIATTMPAATEEEAAAFIEQTRKRYWDARHNCYAYVVGEQGKIMKCSDDGEPAQTAGRPMLDVLLGEGIRSACVVVTRYFGGILLGTGGLVRAYSAAVKEGLKNSRILERTAGRKMCILTDYSGMGKIRYMIGKNEIPLMDIRYEEQVEITVMVPEERAARFTEEITEATGGRARIHAGEPEYFGLDDGRVVPL